MALSNLISSKQLKLEWVFGAFIFFILLIFSYFTLASVTVMGDYSDLHFLVTYSYTYSLHLHFFTQFSSRFNFAFV